jgi:hypothetical protein
LLGPLDCGTACRLAAFAAEGDQVQAVASSQWLQDVVDGRLLDPQLDEVSLLRDEPHEAEFGQVRLFGQVVE